MRRLLHSLALYAFHVCFVRPLLRWGVGVRYRRLNLVPDGPCLVVSNHNSHLDAAVLMTMFPLRRLARVHPVAAADYFGASWFMNMMAMLFMNGIPIQRRPARGEDPLVPIVERLKAGETMIFFPEGSRGEAGVVARFRAGIGKLVQEVPGLLVLPVFLSGPERIWPRGEVVPVPLSIDANIGRPRTYAALDDPREIAGLVRADVLSLAPPPPPVPGERPVPPLRVAVCGVDDSSVSELTQALSDRLGRHGPTLGVTESCVLEADGTGVREATGPLPVGRERVWARLLAALFRTGPRFGGPRFADLVERAQLNEALSRGRNTRFVVEEGSVLADLLASARTELRPEPDEREMRDLLEHLSGQRRVAWGKSWRLLRGAPAIWVLNTFHLSRAVVPDVLVLLESSVSELMRRLRSEGVGLRPYQNESGLERLQAAYREVAEFLRRRRKVEIVAVDPSIDGAGEAAERVEQACVALRPTGMDVAGS